MWEGSATNYWVLAKGSGGANDWRRLPGSQAKVDVPVEVEIEFARDGDATRVQYRMDGAESAWLEVAGGASVHGASANGRMHSLAARYENFVPSRAFVIKMAATD